MALIASCHAIHSSGARTLAIAQMPAHHLSPPGDGTQYQGGADEAIMHPGQRPSELNDRASCKALVGRSDPSHPAAKPGKPRDVINVCGDLRRFQERLLRWFFRKLSPSPYSHGSVPKRSIKTNVAEHADSVFVFTADVSNFYPSISHARVYRLFVERLGCSPDVARICTRLCTHDFHLALGLVTSPALADQIIRNVDQRIAGACRPLDCVFTRYVDDLTISASFDLRSSGLPNLVTAILKEHGFALNPAKNQFGRLAKGVPITKITIRRGHPDVRREYLDELNRQLDDAINLGADRDFVGPYFTRGQLAGRVQFVGWVNPGRSHKLRAKFNTIPWGKVASQAAIRGYVAAKKRLVPRSPSLAST